MHTAHSLSWLTYSSEYGSKARHTAPMHTQSAKLNQLPYLQSAKKASGSRQTRYNDFLTYNS